MRPIIEPFRIKSVGPIRMTTCEERRGLLARAGWASCAATSPMRADPKAYERINYMHILQNWRA